MADSKIENLPVMTTPDTATLFPVEDVTAGNVTKQLSVANADKRWLLFYNVKTYGAKGDGTTDDTSAIQAAATAAGAVGGTLYFPPGTYVITDKITLSSGITVLGASDQFDLPSPTCMIKQTATNKDIFYGSDIGQVLFRNLCLQGTGSGSGIGIDLVRSLNANNRYFRFENMYIRNTGGDGIYITNAIVTQFDRVITESCVGDGFHIVGLSSVAGTSCTFTACYGDGNLQSAFHLDTMIYCTFNSCAADACGIGYWLKACQGIAMNACGVENPNNRSTNYPGIPYKIDGSNGIVMNACYELGTLASGKGIWLTNNSYGIGIHGFNDINNGASAKWLTVDSGSNCTVSDPFTFGGVTNNGSITWLNDSTGAMIVPASFVAGVATLSVTGGAVATNAYAANSFEVSTTVDLTISNPTNPQDGQEITYRIKNADSSSHSLTLGSAFDVGAFTISNIVAGKYDYLKCKYNSASSKWDVINYAKGY